MPYSSLFILQKVKMDTDLIRHDVTTPRYRYKDYLGIYPVIWDHEEDFRRLSTVPVIANRIDLTTEEGKRLFNQTVYSRYDGDVFSNVPTCPCGSTRGGNRIGRVCPKCGNKCLPNTEQPIESIVWIEGFDQVPRFLNITVYAILKKEWSIRDFSILDYLIDPYYHSLSDTPEIEGYIESFGFKRGINYFVENFDDIADQLCESSVLYSGTKRKAGRTTRKFLTKYRHLIFSKVLPFPSKVGFILESSTDRVYADPKMAPAISALQSVCGISSMKVRTIPKAESKVARAIKTLSEYYLHFESRTDNEDSSGKVFPKKGIYRKLVYGCDPHWTARAVISPEFRVHNHDQITIPWRTAVLLLKLHIANKLLKEGYTPNEILTLIYDNILRTHPKLIKIIQTLIDESPDGYGIPAMITRFPVLKLNSNSLKYIKRVWLDPYVLCIAVSVLAIKAANADYDGDYESLQLALENRTTEFFKRHADAMGIMSFDQPFKVSDHAMQPAPIVTTLNNRLYEGEEESVEYED